MEEKSALILGASGLIGSELLHLLLKSKKYNRVIALVRKSLGVNDPKLEEKIIDFEGLDKFGESFRVCDVFCCLGTTIKKAKTQEAFKEVDLEYPLMAAKLSQEMKVQRFLVVSSMGADPNSTVFYSRIKGQMEKGLEVIGLASLQIFRPSLLLGQRKEIRAGENIAAFIAPGLRFIFKGPLKKYQPIAGKTVALAMYKAAQDHSGGKQLYLSSDIVKKSMQE